MLQAQEVIGCLHPPETFPHPAKNTVKFDGAKYDHNDEVGEVKRGRALRPQISPNRFGLTDLPLDCLLLLHRQLHHGLILCLLARVFTFLKSSRKPWLEMHRSPKILYRRGMKSTRSGLLSTDTW